jgi:DNA-binding transcriptional LysR family regulator
MSTSEEVSISSDVRRGGAEHRAAGQTVADMQRWGGVDLDLLAQFVAVAEAGSFTAAARRLGVPKSTTSRAVAALEGRMGVQLLHRTTRHVALSSAGAALYERVAPLVTSLLRALEDVPERGEQPSGKLRVTGPIDLGAVVLPPVVAAFSARYPAVQVEVDLSNRVVDLVAEGVDLALRIVRGRLRDSSLVARAAGVAVGHVYASPVYLARRGTPRTAAELQDHEWVLFREMLELDLGGETLRPRSRIVGSDLLLVRDVVRAGAGLGFLPDLVAEVAPELVQVLPRLAVRTGSMWIVHPARKNVPRKVTAFRDALLAELQRRTVER